MASKLRANRILQRQVDEGGGYFLEYGTLISVVMPVFNRAHLVPRVVGSILAQTYRNLDVVIVDDCSTDEIEGAVAALNDPRVRLIRRERNGGAGASRNTGILAARGDWIAFHDSDDYCTSDRIELSVRKMMELPEDYIGVYGMALFYTEVLEAEYRRKEVFFLPHPSEPHLSGDMAARTRQGNMMNLPTILVRRLALEAAGPFDERLRQNVDWDLCLRLTQQGKFGFIPEVLILSSNPIDPLIEATKISRSALQGARSFVRITGKLRRAGMTGPHLAAHYANAGRNLLRVNRPKLARPFLRASLAEDPWKLRIWAHYLFSFTPTLHARLRTVNRHGFSGR
jgi:glycosyltransferase involved in cell wall biosynthesis